MRSAGEYHYTTEVVDGDFVGRVDEFPSLAAHGSTEQAAREEIEKVVGYAIEDLAESGEPIPEPHP